MKEIVYNKLVRDRIPEIIEKSEKQCTTSILNDEQYIAELKKKLAEESLEVQSAPSRAKTVEELGDLLEVMETLQHAFQITPDEIHAAKENKALTNGRFEQRIFLRSVYEED